MFINLHGRETGLVKDVRLGASTHQRGVIVNVPASAQYILYFPKDSVMGISPRLTTAESSRAQNAEHSKSTAIIIRAVLLWTLMAVPVLLPRHIHGALLRLEAVNY